MPNGLLPPLRPGGRPAGGVGPTGRGAAGVPGRGGTRPGLGLGAAVPTSMVSPPDGGWRRCRAACVAALTAASCSALRVAARASAAATSMSCALAGLTAGPPAGAGGAGTGLAVRFCGAGRAGAFVTPAGCATGAGGGVLVVAGLATNTSRSRRATGASTVLDADLTNSPISLSLASTILLSTPSSFASSCTRAFPATALLTPRSHGTGPAATSLVHLKPDHFSDFIVCSCWSSYLAVRMGRVSPTYGGPECEALVQRAGVEDTGDAQRAPEGPAALRQRETAGIGMQMCAPTRPSACRVGLENGPHRDNPQQLGGRRTLPAPHAGAHRGRASYHCESLPCKAPLAAWWGRW
jgi:hypothetical protein